MNNKPPISARYSDLLTEQDDPALLNLVEDLDALYTSHQLPARLERPVEANRLVVGERSQSPAPLPSQLGTLSSFVPRRRTRWSRLNTLAAVLFTVFLVGALAGTFYAAHRAVEIGQEHGRNIPVSHSIPPGNVPITITPALSSTIQEPIGQIHMMNASEGWARTWLEGGNTNTRDELLHTSDGGVHWQNVTPAQYGTLAGENISYISGIAAWAEMIDNANAAVFVRTTDGGQTWQASAPLGQPLGMVPPDHAAANINYVTFLTPTIGWLLVATYNGIETVVGEILYHTTDGGLTWHELTSSTSTDASTSGRLPLPGAYTGLSFINASTGWIMGSNVSLAGVPEGGGSVTIREPWLYVTHDGGQTWRAQILPNTSSIEGSASGIVTYPPQFFSTSDGLLTVSSWSPGEIAISVYATHDGGATWQGNGFVAVFLAQNSPGTTVLAMPNLVATFADMNAGAFWEDSEYQNANTLATTHDGGQNWIQTRLSFPASVGGVPTTGQIEFVSARVGWLLLLPAGKFPSFAPVLLKTLDGGKTWTQVHYTVS